MNMHSNQTPGVAFYLLFFSVCSKTPAGDSRQLLLRRRNSCIIAFCLFPPRVTTVGVGLKYRMSLCCSFSFIFLCQVMGHPVLLPSHDTHKSLYSYSCEDFHWQKPGLRNCEDQPKGHHFASRMSRQVLAASRTHTQTHTAPPVCHMNRNCTKKLFHDGTKVSPFTLM